MSDRVTIRIDGSACYMDDEPDENGVLHGEWKHSEVPVSAVWNDEDCEWEEWHPPDPEPRRRRERDEPMSDRVTITMSDGTTREVDESTPVESPEGIITVAHYAEVHAQPVTAIYEPTREHWTPYQPWMRDLLADDARVSWANGTDDIRLTWGRMVVTHRPTSHDIAVHPDDAPERPAEDDPLVAVLERVAERPGGDYAALARAAREHIEEEGGNGGVWKAAAVAAHRERKKAEADVERLTRERDEWKDWHAALRADVERTRGINAGAELTFADEVIRGILDRDDERGEQE